MEELLKKCALCPRECHTNRICGEYGFCGCLKNVRVARSALHFGEEPCISGNSGSGTVFFSGCSLKCVFCQNRAISMHAGGEEITSEKLGELFLKQQSDGAENINLVTPTHFIPQIIYALDYAKIHGLKIPVVYNTGGYEKASSIKLLDGYVDVYLPDIKYYNDKYAQKYSNAPHYFEYASKALEEMLRQTGKIKFNKRGIAVSGTIVRHLLLPGLLFDSKKILDYLHSEYSDDIYISIMNQYTPVGQLDKFPELKRRISKEYYDCLIDYAVNIGIKNAYVQSEGTADESFIPEFYDGQYNQSATLPKKH